MPLSRSSARPWASVPSLWLCGWLLASLTSCASPLPPSLRWEPLPDYQPPELPPAVGGALAVEAGDLAPDAGMLLDDSDYLALEARSEAVPLLLDALALERAGRESDRAWASSVYSSAVEACRRRQRVACAVCAALSGVVSGASVGGVAGAVCR
jgi:hypothetical protein